MHDSGSMDPRSRLFRIFQESLEREREVGRTIKHTVIQFGAVRFGFDSGSVPVRFGSGLGVRFGFGFGFGFGPYHDAS